MSRFRFIVMGLGISLAIVTPAARAEEMTEKQKIERFLKHVESLDASFIRNDDKHDAKAAAKFLRVKWERADSEIKTAKDFIDKVASKSSTSGKPYLIRFKDGKEHKAGDYLLAELKKIEKSANEKEKR